MNRDLAPHQARTIGDLRARLSAGARRIMVQLPTGAGKTLLAASVVEGALRKGKRALFTVPAVELVNQTIAAFEAEGIQAIGVMQAAHELSDIRQPIQIASVQTLARRKVPEFDIALIDEAHLRFAVIDRILTDPALARVPIIGLSATPWAKGLGAVFEDLIIGSTTRELIDAGWLSPFRCYAPSHPDLKDVRTLAGDFRDDDLSHAMDKPALVADVVDTWKRRGESRQTLVFAVDRKHAKHLEEQFKAAGVTTGYIDGFTKPEDRAEIARMFNSGDIQVVCNVGVLTTGIDWDVRCIVLARPTKSEMLYVQIVGRGLRRAAGKADCLILDHSDTSVRLGLVTDIHHASLDDGKGRGPAVPRDATPLPKECPSCSFLRPPRTPVCPGCGFKPLSRSAVQVDDGELVEITAAAKKGAGRRVYSPGEKRDLYGQLLWYARRHGRKHGWAAHSYRDLVGVWPRGLEGAPEIPAEPHVLNWIRSRNIRFAKQQQARDAG